jgi:tetraacyldisaccharide-1-P 4'-kinase
MAHTFGLHGADAMLTTEKDAVNLCEETPDLIAPLHLYWLKIRAELDRETQFLAEVERRLCHI